MNLKERKSAFGQVNHEAIGKLIQRLREASQSDAVKVVDDVAGLRIGQNDGSSLTGYSAGYQTACEEIRYRLVRRIVRNRVVSK